MKLLLVFQIFLSALLAHGHEHQHLHFFSSLHTEYFLIFLAGFVGVLFIYFKLIKGQS